MSPWQGLTFFSLCSLGCISLPPPELPALILAFSPIIFLCDTSSELNLVISREYLDKIYIFSESESEWRKSEEDC